jgi:hypothetical protein
MDYTDASHCSPLNKQKNEQTKMTTDHKCTITSLPRTKLAENFGKLH